MLKKSAEPPFAIDQESEPFVGAGVVVVAGLIAVIASGHWLSAGAAAATAIKTRSARACDFNFIPS